MKKLFLSIAIALTFWSASGQSELIFPLFHDVFQSSYLTPTVRPEHTISIGLPGISSVYFQGIHNGFVPNAVSYWANDTLWLSPKNLLNELSDRNMLHADLNVDLFHLRIRVYNWDFWLGIRQRHNFDFFYPKDLFSLVVQGNASHVGKTFDFSNLGLNVNLHREYTLGVASEYERWVFGGRVSLLQGLSNLYFNPNSLYLSIEDENFAHTGGLDATLYSSGIPLDSDRMLNSEVLNELGWVTDYFTRFRNPGVALSLGASYKFDQRTTFSFSVSDLGFIHWSDSTLNYNVKGETSFTGFDAFSDLINQGELNMDSLFNALLDNFSDEEFVEAYNVWLPTKFYLSANYQLASRTHVGIQFYGVINRNFYPGVSLGVTQGLGRIVQLTAMGSYNQRTLTNFGFGLMLNPGPIQLYLIADNIYTPLKDPLTFTNLNVRVGLNLVFGRAKTNKYLPYR